MSFPRCSDGFFVLPKTEVGLALGAYSLEQISSDIPCRPVEEIPCSPHTGRKRGVLSGGGEGKSLSLLPTKPPLTFRNMK